MTGPAKVAQLLRDVKGIFEVEGDAYFLVSISDEAAKALELGAVRSRNEFNSSFYTVIELKPLAPTHVAELLGRRAVDFDARTAVAIGVLTGGLPREAVRVAHYVSERLTAADVTAAVALIIRDELDAFDNSVVTFGSDGWSEQEALSAADKVTVDLALSGRESTSIPCFTDFLRDALGHWDMNAQSPVWCRRFQEEWRRLVVRLAVAALILDKPCIILEPQATADLQNVVRACASSAAVGRLRLGQYLSRVLEGYGGDGREPDEVTSECLVLLVANSTGDGRPGISAHRWPWDRTTRETMKALEEDGIVVHDGNLLRSTWRLSSAARARLTGEGRFSAHLNEK